VIEIYQQDTHLNTGHDTFLERPDSNGPPSGPRLCAGQQRVSREADDSQLALTHPEGGDRTQSQEGCPLPTATKGEH